MTDWEAFYTQFRRPGFIPGYEIQNRLGGGAFGEVYKARKTSIGKAYAIKFLKLEEEAAREVAERELDHVRLFAAIDHPNLVSIEDMGLALGVPYLVLGYAGEDTLARRLKRGDLERDAALRYFVQACRGVLALHDRRLAHFDLKPSNVFIKGDVARVGDYGLARLLVDGHRNLSAGRGTPLYMAPEMAAGRADHRADIYSLGVLLYECFTGRPPFGGGREDEPPVRSGGEPPPPDPAFPPELYSLVERCLRIEARPSLYLWLARLNRLQPLRQRSFCAKPAVSNIAASLLRRSWTAHRSRMPRPGSTSWPAALQAGLARLRLCPFRTQ